MAKKQKKNFPDFVKTNLEGALAALASLEKEARELYEKLLTQTFGSEELKGRLAEIQAKAASARKDIEKVLTLSVSRAYALLNIPTKTEFDAIAKKVGKIQTDLQKLTGAKPAKKAAKKSTKKPRRA